MKIASKLNLSIPPGRKRATILLAAGSYINTAIVMVQGLLLVPLYLYYIGAHTYGLWLASGGIIGMLALVNFGISSLFVQRIASAYAKKDTALAGSYFINGVLIYVCICILYTTVGWILSFWLIDILSIDPHEKILQQCFQLAILAMAFAILNECLRSFSQALLHSVVSLVGMAVGRIIGIIVTVCMLLNEFGLWAIPMGILVAEAITLLVNLFYALLLFRGLSAKLSFDFNIIKEYMHTSPALLMARTGNTLSQESEPLLITIFLSAEITALYMIARKSADILFQALSVTCGASYGAFSHLVGEKDFEKIKQAALNLLLIVFASSLIAFATYVGINQGFVALWVGKDFILSEDVIFMIGLGFFSRSLRAMIWQLLNGLGDFIYTSFIILAEGTGKICLAIILLNFIGVIGVPIALVVSSLLSFIILAIRINKKLLFKIEVLTKVSLFLSVVTLFGYSLFSIDILPAYQSWIIFILYASVLSLTLMLLFSLINFRICYFYFNKWNK